MAGPGRFRVDHISLCSNDAEGREFLRGCLGGIFLLMTPSGPALLLLLLL